MCGKFAVHLAVAGSVYDSVFFCCPFAHDTSWLSESVSEGFPTYSCTITLKEGLLHCILTSIQITGITWYCFILKNVENCKKKIHRVKKL